MPSLILKNFFSNPKLLIALILASVYDWYLPLRFSGNFIYSTIFLNIFSSTSMWFEIISLATSLNEAAMPVPKLKIPETLLFL